MKKLIVERLVRQVARTLEIEIDCEECGRLSAEVVDAILSGQIKAARFAHVFQHLDVCQPCSEEFEALHRCAQMDRDANWPALQQLAESIIAAQNPNRLSA